MMLLFLLLHLDITHPALHLKLYLLDITKELECTLSYKQVPFFWNFWMHGHKEQVQALFEINIKIYYIHYTFWKLTIVIDRKVAW